MWRLRSVASVAVKQRHVVGSRGVLRKFSTIVPSGSTPEDIINECHKVRASVQEVNDKFKGPLEKSSQKNTILPFVFCLGNHSSGKSSFINYVCQRKIQVAGVAPTDDCFTIIVPGPSDVDRDGPSLIGDPDMGFESLRSFGPPLVHHTQLKIRSNTSIGNFMVVDTPGMIDSPMVRDQAGHVKHAVMDRGYDFESVCRWYAERADVILLFFDPDKPGTTGETLQILTNSLVGLDHKLHIILNKADQFKKIHDFARAYGSLCWNLSKVIQRKDLPRIYTMCLPQSYRAVNASGEQEGEESLGRGLADLEATREEVVEEVLNAPKRRVDNEISRLTDSVSILHMHLTVVDELSKSYKSAILKSRLIFGLTATSGVGLTVGALMLALPPQAIGAVGALSAVGSLGLFWWQNRALKAQADNLITDESMERAYKKLYARKIAAKDEFTATLWTRVHEHLIMGLNAVEFKLLDKVKVADLKRIEQILEVDIPNLRRKAQPAFNKKI